MAISFENTSKSNIAIINRISNIDEDNQNICYFNTNIAELKIYKTKTNIFLNICKTEQDCNVIKHFQHLKNILLCFIYKQIL